MGFLKFSLCYVQSSHNFVSTRPDAELASKIWHLCAMNTRIIIFLIVSSFSHVEANPEARRLFEDLLGSYNKLIRPVGNTSDVLEVRFKMRLSQLLDVHEKNQIITTNVWLEHEWYDPKLSWDPVRYGNVTVLYVPGEMIWLPDIVLYNNADGNYQVTIMTKATISYNGKVNWDPPAIYKSMCHINVQWFPFDQQTCDLKFGSWTYDGFQVDLLHKTEQSIITYNDHDILIECVENGIDLSDYYRSTEWDLLAVPGWKKKATYPCCPTPYIDITYKIYLRRKTLFYTVNLILPCIGISFLTVLVFYLPIDSGEKVTLSISILISLTVFFLLLVEIIPSTSLVVPLIGKYLLFTMVMVTLSICVTVIVINFHFRSQFTHTMSTFTREWFLVRLPKLLFMTRPLLSQEEPSLDRFESHDDVSAFGRNRPCTTFMKSTSSPKFRHFTNLDEPPKYEDNLRLTNEDFVRQEEKLNGTLKEIRPMVMIESGQGTPVCGCLDTTIATDQEMVKNDTRKLLRGIQFIANHLKQDTADQKVMEDWKFVAMVIDRFFLVLFCLACVVGTSVIILQAPTLYDYRVAIDSGDQNELHALNGIMFCHV